MAEHADRPATDISPKVAAATAAAALTTILVWGVELATGLDIPSIVEGSFTTLLVFGAGYLVRDNR